MNSKMIGNMVKAWTDGTISADSVKYLRNDGFSDGVMHSITGVGQCMVNMVHPATTDYAAGSHMPKREYPCILPKTHLNHDSDHVDIHGHTAPVLVHQATIREVAALAEHDRQAAQAETFAALVNQVSMGLRLFSAQEFSKDGLHTGLKERHADGSISFPIEQGDDNQLCVTVTVKAGWK